MTNYRDLHFKNTISILSMWIALMLALYSIVGIKWFHAGDFSFRTAMAYHGILIPAWLLLLISYSRHFSRSDFMIKLLSVCAISGAILTGTGSLFIHSQGISFGTIVQVIGMIIAEITALLIIIASFIYYFKNKEIHHNQIAWWTVSLSLIGLSVAAPLGHIAGAAKDFGASFHLFINFANKLGLSANDAIDGFTDSHSHQILSAFLAAAFSMPFLQEVNKKQNVLSLEKIGLFIVLIATIAQVFLYQYCAWTAWEPPTLFSNGVNGIPLDDFILSILGLGFLFLIPSLLRKNKKRVSIDYYSHFTKQILSIILIAYIISVVALGIFIEFHEQFFGHGQANSLGLVNDLSYIRAHILFGFMIIPVLLAVLLNKSSLDAARGQKTIDLWFILFLIIIGFIGVFAWTFFLFPSILKISFYLSIVYLFMFAFHFQPKK